MMPCTILDAALAQRRIADALTLDEQADAIGVSARTLYRMLEGTRISRCTLHLIAAYLGITEDFAEIAAREKYVPPAPENIETDIPDTKPYISPYDGTTMLGEAVRRKRLYLDLSQKQLAQKLGVTAMTVGNAERGTNCGRTLSVFGAFLGITEEEAAVLAQTRVKKGTTENTARIWYTAELARTCVRKEDNHAGEEQNESAGAQHGTTDAQAPDAARAVHPRLAAGEQCDETGARVSRRNHGKDA